MSSDCSFVHVRKNGVFVSKHCMESVNKLDPLEYCQCCILAHQMDETVGTVLVISLVYLVVIISVIATILFARNCWLLRHGVHIRPPNMKRQAVDVLPCFTFKSAYLNGKRIEETCAICLEDYRDEEMLRNLPCLHGKLYCFSPLTHHSLFHEHIHLGDCNVMSL